MLAVVQNPDAARLMGINVPLAISLAYAASTLFAGAAGIMIAPLFNVHSDMGTLFGLKAFAVAILGGITSAWGVMLAGLIFGLTEALITALLGSALHADPQLRAGDRRARADAERPLRPRRGEEGMRLAAYVVGVRRRAGVHRGARTSTTSSSWRRSRITAIVGIGLNVLLGLTGQVSFGHVGFYALGAYTVAILTAAKWSFWAALPVAALVATLTGALLALPAVRVSGPYLAMVTIAFGFIVEHAAVEWRGLTGGQNGLMGTFAPVRASASAAWRSSSIAVAALATLAYCASGAKQLRQGDARGARRRGRRRIDRPRRRCASRPRRSPSPRCAPASPARCSRALSGFVTPSTFAFSQSILFVLVVMIGGAGFVAGPLVGAAIVVLLPEFLAALAEYRLLFFGALLLFVLWLAPEGLVGTALRAAVAAAPPRRVRRRRGDATLAHGHARHPRRSQSLGISFGGVRAAHDISLRGEARRR